MGTANRARGSFNHTTLPFQEANAGRADEYGASIPPGGRLVAYVHSSGPQDGDDEEIKKRLYTSIPTALKFCRANRGDTIIVLPGHAENVDAADDWADLVAGTRIIGLGQGNLRPTLTWTTATSTILLNVANVYISGFIFEMAGPSGTTALTVAAPMTISAAGCSIVNCKIHTEIDADQGTTIAITTTAAADDLTISGCYIYGSGNATLPTTIIRLVGADRFIMTDCVVHGYTKTTTVGVLQMLTTASTGVYIANCSFVNLKAASVHACTGMVGATGVVKDCMFGILDDATLAGWETEGSLMFSGCRTVNLAGEEGGVKTPTSA